MSPYAAFMLLAVLAFVVGAASRTRWVPWILPAALVVYWAIATLQLNGDDQTLLAVFVGVVVVGALAAAAVAGRLLHLWIAERPELDSNQRPTP
jgi:hypothetical protein